MRIRTRLSLWYAAVMLAALSTMGALSYYQFVVQRNEPRRQEMPDGRARPGAAPEGVGRGESESGASGSATRDGRPGGRRHGLFAEVLDILLRVGVPALVMAVAGGWWLMRRSLAPMEALTRAVEKTHERNLHEQLPRSGNGDELDRLTEVFNAMTARLDQSFQRIREFTLHASHELKTPLTIMQGEIETACSEEPLTEAQRDRLLSQLDEVQRLAKIVDGLSLLTKADAGQVSLVLEAVPFDDLVREAVEDAQHLGQQQGIQATLAACEPVTVQGNRHRLRQLLLNVADNAVKYNEPNGQVTISLRQIGADAELLITNTGPGLARELQPKVFDRFFRGDASHSSTVEGSGLGLSIVQWIAQAHGGGVSFDSDVGALTTVTVRLPVVPTA
jgi:signal transduction histidine kinase